jgi:hypothetical protein
MCISVCDITNNVLDFGTVLLVGLISETWWGKTDIMDPVDFGSVCVNISRLVADTMAKTFL